jgi:protein TonB
LNLTYLAPPVTPPAPSPPPPPAAASQPRPAQRPPTHAYVPGKLTAPSFIPKRALTTSSGASVPPVLSAGVAGGAPGGIPGGQVGGVLGGVLGGSLGNAPPPPPPPPVAAAAAPKKPVLVGGDVKEPKLLYGPAPLYPPLAKLSHVSGEVFIDAIINEHGNVTGMRALSGPPLLIPAALAAVAKWKYEPTVLNGVPTPVELKVEVDFNIG